MRKTFTTIIALIISFSGYAQSINYHDVNPDTTVNTWEVFSARGVDIWWHPTPEVVINTALTQVQVLCDNDTLPKALNLNDDISATSAGLWKVVSYKCLACVGFAGTTGNWNGVTNKYLGIRSMDLTGNWRYGWIRLDVGLDAAQFTIKDHAMHSITNTGLKAGQIFPTGVVQYEKNAGNVQVAMQHRTVSFKGLDKNADVSVIDMSGKVLLRKTIEANGTFDMSAYPAGVYMLYLYGKTISQAFKISLE